MTGAGLPHQPELVTEAAFTSDSLYSAAQPSIFKIYIFNIAIYNFILVATQGQGLCLHVSRKRLIFYPPFDIHHNKPAWFEGHFQKSAKHKEKTGTAPLAYDGARGRTGQRRARRALSGRAHRIDGAAVARSTSPN